MPDLQQQKPVSAIRTFLESVAAELRSADRKGSEIDEPAGSRFIEISDTYANGLAAELEKAGEVIDILNAPDADLHAFAHLLTGEIRRRQNAIQLQRSPLVLAGHG
jgi:methionine synthase II (cobalamin-independent)